MRLKLLQNPIFGRILAGLAALAAAGCSSVPDSPAPNAQELSAVQTDRAPLMADAPEPYFEKAFLNPKLPAIFTKGSLETTEEFHARLAQLGSDGQEATLLIGAGNIKYLGDPDTNHFVIATQAWFPRMDLPDLAKQNPMLAGVIVKHVESPGVALGPMSNAFGVTVNVTSYNRTDYMLRLVNSAAFGPALRWPDPDDTLLSPLYFRLGLPITSADPAFREKLKRQQITLAVRGHFESVATAAETNDGHEATVQLPVQSNNQHLILPFSVTEVFLVDLTKNESIARVKL